MILSNQTRYLWVPNTLLDTILHLERDQIEHILALLCLNDLYFLHKHVKNALDSFILSYTLLFNFLNF